MINKLASISMLILAVTIAVIASRPTTVAAYTLANPAATPSPHRIKGIPAPTPPSGSIRNRSAGHTAKHERRARPRPGSTHNLLPYMEQSNVFRKPAARKRIRKP